MTSRRTWRLPFFGPGGRSTSRREAQTCSSPTPSRLMKVEPWRNRRMRERLRRPEMMAGDLLLRMEASGLTATADVLRPHIEFLSEGDACAGIFNKIRVF